MRLTSPATGIRESWIYETCLWVQSGSTSGMHDLGEPVGHSWITQYMNEPHELVRSQCWRSGRTNNIAWRMRNGATKNCTPIFQLPGRLSRRFAAWFVTDRLCTDQITTLVELRQAPTKPFECLIRYRSRKIGSPDVTS
jgi:hypothetical protein